MPQPLEAETEQGFGQTTSSPPRVQQLLDTWGVVQKAHNRKRKYDEVKKDFITQVVEETRRLKRMNDAFEGSCPDGSANNASACFSAIRASLHHGSIERLP